MRNHPVEETGSHTFPSERKARKVSLVLIPLTNFCGFFKLITPSCYNQYIFCFTILLHVTLHKNCGNALRNILCISESRENRRILL